ncbi:MAG: chromosomal replication initiator protein DnaA [Oscillospiraceae bacterium]|nr:chromosomal replication initiator protein DnaA [Oscillospiraceae bacterium]
MYSAAYVWAKILARLEQQLSEVTVSTWLDDAEIIELTEDRLVLYTPSDYRKEIILTQCAPYILEALEALVHTKPVLEVWGETELKRFKEEKRAAATVPLNPQYSFDSFVEAPENRFARQMTMLAAAAPGEKTHNPLLLYGKPGVGKTHLLYAAANRIMETRPELKVVCMKTEAFINEFIYAIRNDKSREFKAKLRKADVLLLDDIQFLAGKETTQEEFYHIFNTLYENNKQIILTSDRRPMDMPTLATQLIDRFGEGVMVEVPSPGAEARLQIVEIKSKSYQLPLPHSLKKLIADSAENVRQLEGILKKLRAMRELGGATMDADTVGTVVHALLGTQLPRCVTAAMVLEAVCAYYHVSEADLKSSNRSKTVTTPRQVAMYLMQTMVGMKPDAIGKQLLRDRATVIHSVSKVDNAQSGDEAFRKQVDSLRANIEAKLAD